MDTSTGLVLVAVVPVLVGLVQYMQSRSKAKDEKEARAEARQAAREAVQSAREAARDAKDAAESAAAKVTAVAVAAEAQGERTTQQLSAIAKVGNDTHTLVNSNMGVQLKLNAALAKRISDMSGLTDDRKAAELAQMLYDEHVKKQAAVDARQGETEPHR
jgi:rRNA maturation endonuclease Nob1